MEDLSNSTNPKQVGIGTIKEQNKCQKKKKKKRRI